MNKEVWQTLDTAPRDGTMFLVCSYWDIKPFEYFVAQFCSDYKPFEEGQPMYSLPDYKEVNLKYDYDQFRWLPLPQAPELD